MTVSNEFGRINSCQINSVLTLWTVKPSKVVWCIDEIKGVLLLLFFHILRIIINLSLERDKSSTTTLFLLGSIKSYVRSKLKYYSLVWTLSMCFINMIDSVLGNFYINLPWRCIYRVFHILLASFERVIVQWS